MGRPVSMWKAQLARLLRSIRNQPSLAGL